MSRQLRSRKMDDPLPVYEKGDEVQVLWKDRKYYEATVLSYQQGCVKVYFKMDKYIDTVKEHLVKPYISTEKEGSKAAKGKKKTGHTKNGDPNIKNDIVKDKEKKEKSSISLSNDTEDNVNSTVNDRSDITTDCEYCPSDIYNSEGYSDSSKSKILKEKIHRTNICEEFSQSQKSQPSTDTVTDDTVTNDTEYINSTADDRSEGTTGSEYCPSDGYSSEDSSESSKSEILQGKVSRKYACKINSESEKNQPSRDTAIGDYVSRSGFTVLGTNNQKNKKNYCPYCFEPFSKLPRHLETKHADELEVSSILNAKTTDEIKRRQTVLYKLKNLGNHIHNCGVLKQGWGNLVVVYRPKENANVGPYDNLPCTNCYGYFAKKELYKHKCPLNQEKKKNENVVFAGRNLLPVPLDVDQNVKEILSTMKLDDITNIVRSDRIICEYMRRAYHSKGGSQIHKKAEIRNNARELGRLVKEMRILKGNKSYSVSDMINPCEYKDIIEALRHLSGYEGSSQSFQRPELARKLGLHIKTCGLIAKSFALEENNQELVEKFQNFLHLHEMNFFVEIGAEVLRYKKERSRSIAGMLPLSKDVTALTRHLKSVSEKSIEMLRNEAKKEDKIDAWTLLQKATLSQIIIFNRRREGEVSRMKVKDYMQQKDSQQESDIMSSLTKIERGLCKILTRIEIEGKCGRNVPVLLTPDFKKAVDLLLEWRDRVGVSKDNIYLFASCKKGAKYHFRGSACIRRFSSECNAHNPELLRSTKLRKHVATLAQVLNLKENELESLARFMGHDIKIHREYYRLPDNVQQTAKLSKIFLSMESGKLLHNGGRTLDDIEVSLDFDDFSADDEYEEPATLQEKDCYEQLEESFSDQNTQSSKVDSTWAAPQTVQKNFQKKPWTADEKNAVERHLLSDILLNKIPGADKIRNCISQEPCLSNRSWRNIKDYCRNKISRIQNMKI